MEHVHYEDQSSRYLCIGCVEKVTYIYIHLPPKSLLYIAFVLGFKINYISTPPHQVLCLLACWVEDPNSEAYKRHLARIPDYLWLAEDGMKMQVPQKLISILPHIYIYKLKF